MPELLIDGAGITRRHGTHTILESVDVRVHDGDRLAVVGPNGAGKTTLLRALAGLEPLDGGRVAHRGSVGYLPQMAGEASAHSARELILTRIGVAEATRALAGAQADLAVGSEAAAQAYADALERWLALGGPDAEARIATAVTELGLHPALLDRPPSQVSGGQASRLGLAALRAARCDVLLLDEPSNHLDEDGLARLRALLAGHRGAVVLVSHDRTLLGDFARELLELDLATGSAAPYHGGWEAYVRERAHARARAAREHEQAVARRAGLAAAAAETRTRAARSIASAPAKHDDDKHAREWVRARAQGMQHRARVIDERLARIEVPDRPWSDPALRLHGRGRRRHGDWLIGLEGAVLARGRWRRGPIDLEVAPDARIALRGANGAGKSTLLAALAGEPVLAGGRRRLAPGAVVVRLGQERDGASGHPSVVSAMRALTGADETRARTALGAYGLRGDAALQHPARLSPGERTRAQLAIAAAMQADCLLLDEPTNHLDVAALEILEAALAGWAGALVVATHDRALVGALALGEEVVL